MKMGIFHREKGRTLLVRQFTRHYPINSRGLWGDIEPERWLEAFLGGICALGAYASNADAVALSGTTPGLTAMDRNGRALYPAILMLDGRSRKQAARIIETVGIETLLRETGNMPVSGGCSLASILWLEEEEPEVFRRTVVFGHSNTYLAKYLTGNFALDPSSASLTALYNTARNDLTWNQEIAEAFGLSTERLPRLLPSAASAGRVSWKRARELGLSKEPPVIIGGNDAVLAAASLGIREPGEVVNVNGTCEISLVCLDRCLSSPSYNVRAHVVPDRWLTLYVMNAGGKALEWFHRLFCSEMTPEEFFDRFIPESLETWLEKRSSVVYVPYLLGSRYSQQPLTAAFQGLTPDTGRRELLAALVRGLCEYQKAHLQEMEKHLPLADTIRVTGGAVGPSLIRAKEQWMRDCRYVAQEQSSLKGAAALGFACLETADRAATSPLPGIDSR